MNKPYWEGQGEKRTAPAAARNREPIAKVLAQELPERGTVLEIASGSGEHALWFAAEFPALEWQPSDHAADALVSASAWRANYKGDNLREPIVVDAIAPAEWSHLSADAILCINMVHISPWEASEGLFEGAAAVLSNDAPLILYGPYLEKGVETAKSNLDFDQSLKNRDPSWGLRQLEDIDELASNHGFARSALHRMPANNLTLVYRKL